MSDLPMHLPAKLGADRYTFRNVSTARLQDTWTGSQKLIMPNCLESSAEAISESNLAGYAIETLYGANTYPDHDTLRCMDHMINRTDWSRSKQVAAGNWLSQYFIKNHQRLGVYLMIWNTQIIRSYDKTVDGELVKAWHWAHYDGSSNPHTDHVHVEYIEGFKYSPPDPHRDGAWYEVNTDTLNGRESPSTSAQIVASRNRGYTMRIKATRSAGGRKWGQDTSGVWYAMEYLRITGDEYLVETAELNTRYEPTIYSPVAAVRKKGYTARIQTEVACEGHTWGRASGGLWYATEYLKKKGS